MNKSLPLALLLTANVALAQANDLRTRFLRCSSIDSSFQRVQCYDDLAKEIRGSEPAARYTPTPVPTELPLDRVTISARNPVKCPKGMVKPEIIVACKNGTLTMELNSKTELGAGDILLNIRYDADEVIRNLRWRIRPDKQTIYSLRQEELALELSKRDNFEVKLMPADGEPIPFSFDLAAQKSTIKAVVSACERDRR